MCSYFHLTFWLCDALVREAGALCCTALRCGALHYAVLRCAALHCGLLFCGSERIALCSAELRCRFRQLVTVSLKSVWKHLLAVVVKPVELHEGISTVVLFIVLRLCHTCVVVPVCAGRSWKVRKTHFKLLLRDGWWRYSNKTHRSHKSFRWYQCWSPKFRLCCDKTMVFRTSLHALCTVAYCVHQT